MQVQDLRLVTPPANMSDIKDQVMVRLRALVGAAGGGGGGGGAKAGRLAPGAGGPGQLPRG